MGADAEQTRFVIDVDSAQIADLQFRLRATRLPQAIAGSGWDYGMDADILSGLVDHWANRFDWRAWEIRLNQLDHRRTIIRGHAIHYIHVRSAHANATPLLMIHGWPGSFIEFLDVIDPLVAPERHGGNPEDAFHLVIPSLPGFGFSEPPRERGWGPALTASVYTELMKRLGYERYGLQGGDFGAIVVAHMGRIVPDRLIGLHTNMPLAPPVEGLVLSAQERQDVDAIAAFTASERAYALIQATKPMTIGVALNDSPAGLCAWIAEKFHAWTDPASVIDRDALLANISLYWFTQTAASAAQYYREHFTTPPVWTEARIEVPTGVARFPFEMNRPPRAWVQRVYNVVHWSELPRGGHFAAFEQPGLFVDDLRAFFAMLRTRV